MAVMLNNEIIQPFPFVWEMAPDGHPRPFQTSVVQQHYLLRAYGEIF